MVKALQYKTFGKPDVLQLVDLPLVHPKADEVSIKVSHSNGLGYYGKS
ncbi:Quinone oxidoreductase [Lactococcus lactis subsp. lactis]|nr:hypothetical protein [Lactococcus lactis]KST95185.1 Quinone oxidoreductase [Lactococcus lactis subsp. lactis]